MKKKVTLLSVLMLIASLMAGGCGTSMYELTDEEEDLIVQYAAYTLAKHNIHQPDGLTDISSVTEEESEQETQTTDTEIPEDTESIDEPAEDKPEVTPAGNTTLGDEITLAEAVGYGDSLSVSYQGFHLTDNYKEGNHFSIKADEGETFLVMEFTMENLTSADLDVDVLATGSAYRACADGTSWVPQKVTLLLHDLSTYQGTLAAGEQVEAVLLFEVPLDNAEDISEVALSVVSNGVTYPVGL